MDVAEAAEIQREQAYFDVAREHRERARHELAAPPTAGANPKDSVVLRVGNELLASTFKAPDEAVAFGRIDTADGNLYIGYHLIADADREPLVINWKSPVGTRFYESTHENPLGVIRRRQYEFVGDTNQLRSFEDTLFQDLAARVEALEQPKEIDDILLADLERTRTGEMQDIVRTIRAAQHEIIRSDLNQVLIVQGGPGTGKTAVALHRVSWLLFNHRDELSASNVAVIGPNPAFVRYIRGILPSLGDHDVRQMPLERLGPEVRTGRAESDEVIRIKGESRMARLLERALRDRIAHPQEPVEIAVGGRTRRFQPEELADQITRLQGSTYSAGRNALREVLRRGNETAITAVDGLLDRLWPALTAPAFLQDLLGSEARLISAAGDDFTAREVRFLYRRSADRLSDEEWSFADVALLDHASQLISGSPADRFDHLVVDEAQDLSPMQLRSIERRSANGSMTILGDLAQSTGPWARNSWDEVREELQVGGVPCRATELKVGYRVPSQAFDLAVQLLPRIAPNVQPPLVVREGPEPTFHRAHDIATRNDIAIEHARNFASLGLTVGVIAPTSHLEELAHRFEELGVRTHDIASEIATGINILDPQTSKGLEFDAVVVVEPQEIADSGPDGLRLLYIALTRTTNHLAIAHIGSAMPTDEATEPNPPSPVVESALAPPDAHARVDERPPVAALDADFENFSAVSRRRTKTVDLLARSVAVDVIEGLPPDRWSDFVEALREELEVSVPRGETASY